MSRKNQPAQAAKEAAAEAVEVEVVETVEAAEPPKPEGVESIEADPAADAPPAEPQPQAEAYVVVSHVKTGGKRYEPGESITAELAHPFLASGAVVKA